MNRALIKGPAGVPVLRLPILLVCGLALLGGIPASAQVSPAEVLDPELKADEAKYFPDLQRLNHAIKSAHFPMSFVLSRYVGLDPQQQAAADTRGIEFVKFKGRVVLKITGNYNAAFNADSMTQNQRAESVFNEVITPILRLVVQEIPVSIAGGAIGFEISFHTRRRTHSFDYEGKEILVLVFDKADAFKLASLTDEAERQEILNRSEVFLNGKEFGLALGGREPLDVGSLERSNVHNAPQTVTGEEVKSDQDSRLSRINQDLPPGFNPRDASSTKSSIARAGSPPGQPGEAEKSEKRETGEVDQLQQKYKSQLDGLTREGLVKFHFVDYAPPAFGFFQNRIYLQLTLRNPNAFDSNATSIYKRAARSFDLFLAPQMKDLVGKIPAGDDFDGLDITLLNQLAAAGSTSSEAVEFFFPLKLLKQFVEAEITNQQLIDAGVVLVNGVRIQLNLQQVE